RANDHRYSRLTPSLSFVLSNSSSPPTTLSLSFSLVSDVDLVVVVQGVAPAVCLNSGRFGTGSLELAMIREGCCDAVFVIFLRSPASVDLLTAMVHTTIDSLDGLGFTDLGLPPLPFINGDGSRHRRQFHGFRFASAASAICINLPD
ncbi:hypothetical protein A2U01_0025584, partial [Trifolium medium]|nr:hypothetical protein [Trifolium medium]